MKRIAQLAGSTCIAITLFLSGKIALADLTPPAMDASTASPDAREGTVGLVMLAFGFLALLVTRKKSA